MAPRISLNQKLLDKYIRHAVYMEQLKAGEARLISRFLKTRVFPDVYKKLIVELSKVPDIESVGNIYRIKRLKRMLGVVHRIVNAGSERLQAQMIKRLEKLAMVEARWNIKTIEAAVPADIEMTMPAAETLRAIAVVKPFEGHKLGTWMKSYSNTTQMNIVRHLRIGIAGGESVPALGKRVQRALDISNKQAQGIARTAVSNVVHQAREETFAKNRDLVRKVQWTSTLDTRTTLVCISLDNKIFEIGDGSPRPPIHFNCRSTVVPIVTSWQEYGLEDPPAAIRASMTGAVPANTSYPQWLKGQPQSVQDKVLGKKRAELYRQGRVQVTKFVGRDLKPLTLKQLARREGISMKEIKEL